MFLSGSEKGGVRFYAQKSVQGCTVLCANMLEGGGDRITDYVIEVESPTDWDQGFR